MIPTTVHYFSMFVRSSFVLNTLLLYSIVTIIIIGFYFGKQKLDKMMVWKINMRYLMKQWRVMHTFRRLTMGPQSLMLTQKSWAGYFGTPGRTNLDRHLVLVQKTTCAWKKQERCRNPITEGIRKVQSGKSFLGL